MLRYTLKPRCPPQNRTFLGSPYSTQRRRLQLAKIPITYRKKIPGFWCKWHSKCGHVPAFRKYQRTCSVRGCCRSPAGCFSGSQTNSVPFFSAFHSNSHYKRSLKQLQTFCGNKMPKYSSCIRVRTREQHIPGQHWL